MQNRYNYKVYYLGINNQLLEHQYNQDQDVVNFMRLHPNQSGSTWRGLQNCPAPCPHPSAQSWANIFSWNAAFYIANWWWTWQVSKFLRYFSDFSSMNQEPYFFIVDCCEPPDVSKYLQMLCFHCNFCCMLPEVVGTFSWKVPVSTHTSPSHRTRRRERRHQSGLWKNRWWLGTVYDLTICLTHLDLLAIPRILMVIVISCIAFRLAG